jgi:hypothetical protein
MFKNRLLAPLAFLGLVSIASIASAQTFPDGGGNLAGADRLRVPGCGRDGGPSFVAVSLGSNGAWTASTSDTPTGPVTATYSGTSTTVRGRIMRLTLDTASLAALETKLETDSSVLCEEAVTISALTTRAALKVNKRETHARIGLFARGTGTTASGDDGNGAYGLRARGPWSPPQQ